MLARLGIQPSSAAKASKTAGTGPTPASVVVTNRSWPGTSTNATVAPVGSVLTTVYSSGAIGRLVPEDIAGSSVT